MKISEELEPLPKDLGVSLEEELLAQLNLQKGVLGSSLTEHLKS
jgi:hypothetical protein